MLTDVLIIKITHKAGSLQILLDALATADISIEYMYGLSIEGESASVVVKTSEVEKAIEVLKANGVNTLLNEDLINY